MPADHRSRPKQICGCYGTPTHMTCSSLPPTPTQLLDLPGVQEATLEAVLYTPPNDEIFDENPCLSCGVCCSHFRVSFYSGELSGETGGTVPVELTTKVGPLRACMKGTEQGEGRCIALRGTLGQPGIHCAIYPDRPTPCRDYQIWELDGSPNVDCQRLRSKHGLPLLPNRPLPAPPALPEHDEAA